jgi:hypothetical protein
MADYRTLYPGKYLQSADFQGKDVNLTIISIKREAVGEDTKVIASFKETKKLMVVNRTNAEALNLMWGPETNNWLNRKVTFYPETMRDPFGDKDDIITAIRVRGSPELSSAKSAAVKRGKKTIKVSVQPTGRGKAAAVKAAPPPDDKLPVSVDDLPPGDPPGLPPLGEDDMPFGDA